ncbi:EAL domain-containing protein [Massilia sp. R2A-15]|uniref:sensor domain-containing protein n=1 Tax=Massilia sp. R2A-15 TaxID=3064278 RepID=UPI002732E485|nr:EAL domain-containing protein [Massilia sp. R2A-15]WLI90317.1 EAL domain-containing protein [Massilia sp. R2A-15]
MATSESTVHAAFLVNDSCAIVTWNAGCEHLFGLRGGSALSRPLAALLVDSSAAIVAREWPKLRFQSEPLRLHIRIARLDGSNPSADLVLTPQTNVTGTPAGCVAQFSARADHSEHALIGGLPLRSIIDVLPGTFYMLRRDGTFALWNKTVEAVTALSSEEMRTVQALEMFDLTEKSKINEKIQQVFERGEQVFVEANLLDKDGHGTPYLLTGARIECHGKFYLCGMGMDISVRHQQEEQLRLRERALHAASNGIVITSCHGHDNPIEYVNPAFERITGYCSDEVIGRDSRFMAAPGLDADARVQLRRAIDQHHEVNVTLRNQRKNGEVFWNDLTITPVADEKGRVTHFIGVINDVTEHKQRTAHLEHEVNHDALTGLANRTLLWDRLEQAIHMAQRSKALVATVLLDLDGFKQINDTLGHEAGDEVLIVVANRLVSAVRESDTVARLSGDEFVLVLVNQPSLRFTLRMVERVRHGMQKPILFNGTEIAVRASIGVSVYPHDGDTAFDLVRAADVAMYHAKGTRKNDVHFFSAEMKTTSEAKQRLEDTMRVAVEKNQLFVVFQPKVCLQTGRIRGFEALLRWNHPEQGLLLPPAFLPEAEENGAIIPFGDLVLEHVCAFLQRLGAAGFGDVPVSVNVSQREYLRPDYVEHVAGVLARFRLPPANLNVEVREEGLARNQHRAAEVLEQLSELGVLRTVDAFGDGLSDLNYLQKLPLSHVKLAKAAVHQISPETRRGPIAKSLIDIGHNMNLTVIAECVETRAQVDFLKSNDCDEMQGLYFKEPLSAAAAEELLGATVSA